MKEFLKKNTDYIIIGIVSIIAFIIGCLAINVWISCLIIGLADLILFIPNLIKKRKQIQKSRHASTERKKDKNKKVKTNDSKKDKNNKKEKKKRKIWKTLLFIFLLLCIAGILAACAFWGYIVKNAPKFDPQELYHQE